MRHTHASALIRAGVDVLTVSRRLGHSSTSMTLDVYGHLMEGADAAAVKAIEGANLKELFGVGHQLKKPIGVIGRTLSASLRRLSLILFLV